MKYIKKLNIDFNNWENIDNDYHNLIDFLINGKNKQLILVSKKSFMDLCKIINSYCNFVNTIFDNDACYFDKYFYTNELLLIFINKRDNDCVLTKAKFDIVNIKYYSKPYYNIFYNSIDDEYQDINKLYDYLKNDNNEIY